MFFCSPCLTIFEHKRPVAIRMPNGAFTSLAGTVDPHHRVAVGDLIPSHRYGVETVTRLVREFNPAVRVIATNSTCSGRHATRHGDSAAHGVQWPEPAVWYKKAIGSAGPQPFPIARFARIAAVMKSLAAATLF